MEVLFDIPYARFGVHGQNNSARTQKHAQNTHTHTHTHKTSLSLAHTLKPHVRESGLEPLEREREGREMLKFLRTKFSLSFSHF